MKTKSLFRIIMLAVTLAIISSTISYGQVKEKNIKKLKNALHTKLDSLTDNQIVPGVTLSVRFKDKTNISLDSGWDYADTHYLILGLIIEKVEGKSYYEVLNGLIIKTYNQSYTKPSEKRLIPRL